MPTQFYATNSRAEGEVTVTRGPGEPLIWIQEARLLVNGTMVDQFLPLLDTPDPIPTHALLRAMFDSTHFPDVTPIQLKLQVWGSDGSYREDVDTAPNFNKTTLYGRYDIEVAPLTWYNNTWLQGDENWKILPTVQSYTGSWNYSTAHLITQQGWPGSYVFADLMHCSLFVIHTHGSPGRLATDEEDYWYYYPNDYSGTQKWMVGGNVDPQDPLVTWLFPALVNAVGSGQPPFNEGNPPITFAYIEACHNGADNWWGEALLWPYYNFYTAGSPPGTENQAVFAFVGSSYLRLAKGTADEFFKACGSGHTVEQARAIAYDWFEDEHDWAEPPSLIGWAKLWGEKRRGCMACTPARTMTPQ